MIRLCRLAVARGFVILAVVFSPVAATAASSSLLRLSDIHFDPFYGCSLGNCDAVLSRLAHSGPSGSWLTDPADWDKAFVDLCQKMPAHPQCNRIPKSGKGGLGDSNYRVFEDALASFSTQAYPKGKPDFIIYTGDFLAHDFGSHYSTYNGCSSDNSNPPCDAASYKQFVDATIAYVAWKIQQQLGVPMYAALGNNDSYCGDYNVAPNSGFLKATAATLAKYSKSFGNQAQQTSFEQGGYYRVQLSGKTRLVVLNTTIYTLKSYNTPQPMQSQSCGRFNTDTFAIANNLKGNPGQIKALEAKLQQPKWADTQWAWLVDELLDAAANSQRLWLVAHVPPGSDAYEGTPYFPLAIGDFASLLANDYFAPQIAGFLAGHTHENEFKLVWNGNNVVGFVLIGPGIDGDHGNNPAYQTFTYKPSDLVIDDYQSFRMHHHSPMGGFTKMKDTFSGYFGYGGPNVSSLHNIFMDMNDDHDEARKDYGCLYSSGNCSLNWIKQRAPICTIANDACPVANSN